MESYKACEDVLHPELRHNTYLIKKSEARQLLKPESEQAECELVVSQSNNEEELSHSLSLDLFNEDVEDEKIVIACGRNLNIKRPSTLAVSTTIVSQHCAENECALESRTANDDVAGMVKSAMPIRKKCGKARRLRPRVVEEFDDDEVEFEDVRNICVNKSETSSKIPGDEVSSGDDSRLKMG